MKKLAFCIILAIFCSCGAAQAADMVRLHVIGETDWASDQQYKLMVRDWALEIWGDGDLESALNDRAEMVGMPRNITVEHASGGECEIVRVRIGRAEGRNWWGMLYPEEAGYAEDTIYYSAIVDWLLSLFGIE